MFGGDKLIAYCSTFLENNLWSTILESIIAFLGDFYINLCHSSVMY